eukprot:SAG11_NODE_7928_length_1080_cov_1.207951_2_plen_177_part_00
MHGHATLYQTSVFKPLILLQRRMGCATLSPHTAVPQGFAGSRLVQPSQQLNQWGVPEGPSTVFFPGKRDISLPMEWSADGAKQRTDGLVADELVPKYKSFMKWARGRAGGKEHVHPFPYDWRRDPSEAARALAKRVAELSEGAGYNVELVAHGTGGLIAFAALVEVAHLVENCVFV